MQTIQIALPYKDFERFKDAVRTYNQTLTNEPDIEYSVIPNPFFSGLQPEAQYLIIQFKNAEFYKVFFLGRLLGRLDVLEQPEKYSNIPYTSIFDICHECKDKEKGKEQPKEATTKSTIKKEKIRNKDKTKE